MVESFSDLVGSVAVNERHPIAPFKFVTLFAFRKTTRQTVGISINILIDGVVS